MPPGRPADNSFKAPRTFSLVDSDERDQIESLHGLVKKAPGSKVQGKPIRVPQPGDKPPLSSEDESEQLPAAGRKEASTSSHKHAKSKHFEQHRSRASLNGSFQPGMNTIDGTAGKSSASPASRMPWKDAVPPVIKKARTVPTAVFYHATGSPAARQSTAQTDKPQHRNASGSVRQTRADPIEISDDEHDTAPVAHASGSRPLADPGPSREAGAADGASPAQETPAPERSAAPSAERATPKARTENPTLKDVLDPHDQLDIITPKRPSAGVVGRLQPKTNQMAASSSALGVPTRSTLSASKRAPPSSSSTRSAVQCRDIRHGTVDILRWHVGDVATIGVQQAPRLHCRFDHLEIQWDARGGQKASIKIPAGHLSQVQYGGETSPYLQLKFEHASKINHELKQHFPEWDESSSGSSSTVHRFLFDFENETVLERWHIFAERFGQQNHYPPCPEERTNTISLPDKAVQTLMNSEDGPMDAAQSAKPKTPSNAERPRPRPSAGTAQAAAPTRPATRSSAAPASARPEGSPSGQLRASRAENSPSGAAKAARGTRGSPDNEVQPGRRKLLPEQEVQRLRYPDDLSVRGVAVFSSDIEKLCDGEFLNDTIIELGLSLLHEKIRKQDAALAEQIHIFSSFFYKRLTENKDKAAGFASVRKWAKTNVFDKKYLVVPINEHLHWYLAIVINPAFCVAPAALARREIELAERAADSFAPTERRQTRHSAARVVLSDDEMEAADTRSPAASAPASGPASPPKDVEMAAPPAERPVPAIELDHRASPPVESVSASSAAATGHSTPDASDVAVNGSGAPSVDVASMRLSQSEDSQLNTPPLEDLPAARRGVISKIPENAMAPASSGASSASEPARRPNGTDPASSKGSQDAFVLIQSSKKRSRTESVDTRSTAEASGSTTHGDAPAATVPAPGSPKSGQALASGVAASPSGSPKKKARREAAAAAALARQGLVIDNAGRGSMRGGGRPVRILPGENRTPSPPPPPPRPAPSASSAAAQLPTQAKYGKLQRQRESPIKTKPVPQKSLEVTERLRGFLQESTTVCVFDSLGGKHGAVRSNLAGYLTRQHLSLQGAEQPGELRNQELLKVEHIDVMMPLQPNLSDCGVFVLHTFESFFAAPQQFVADVIPSRERGHDLWRTDALPGARARWRDEVEALAVAWETAKRAQEEQLRRKKLEARQAAQAASDPPAAGDGDAASPPAPSAHSSGGVEAA